MNEILRQIAELLSEDDNLGLACNLGSEGSKLWCVLTALRGPDDGNNDVKRATTAVIRWKVGIPEDNSGGAITNPDSPEHRNTRQHIVEDHFARHAKNAFRALGMFWSEVN